MNPTLQSTLIALLVLAAVAYLLRPLFSRKKTGCGSGCGCSLKPKPPEPNAKTPER